MLPFVMLTSNADENPKLGADVLPHHPVDGHVGTHGRDESYLVGNTPTRSDSYHVGKDSMSQAVRSSISGPTNIATISMTVSYLAPAVGLVTCNATVVRAGRSVAFAEGEVTDEKGTGGVPRSGDLSHSSRALTREHPVQADAEQGLRGGF